MNKHFKLFFIIVTILIVMFGARLYFQNKAAADLKSLSIKYEAKALADLIISFRKVYQDIFIQNHVKLDNTTIDFLPVKTTNEIAKLFSEYNTYTKFSTVSDKPRNPINIANKRQLSVIDTFNNDKNLTYSFKEIDDKYYYSQPLKITQMCLNCHGKKEDAPSIISDNYDMAYDYKLGELRGILDIELSQTVISDELTNSSQKNIIFVGFLLLFLIILLYIYTKYIIKLDDEKDEQHEKETLDILLHSLPLAVQGYNKNREVIYWNKTSEDLYGYKFDEIKNRKLEDLIIPDFMKEDVVKSIANWYENDIHIPSSEVPLLKKDGSTIFVYSSHMMVLGKSGEKIVFCMDLDLTGQKESQKKDSILAEQSKMAAMGEMIGNIAHQWRQPLSIISSASTGMILQKNFNTLEDKDLIRNCEVINENAQYLSKTIDDFRNFIKGDRTKQVFNLKDNMNSFLNLVNASIKNHSIKMIIDIEKDIKLDGYPNELTQCFINIFNNAKDALKENNDSDDRLIFISTSKNKNNIAIQIKDNAGGIPEDIINKIFEPYFTTKHKAQGTGLGLHMTYSLIIDGMGGTVEANNKTYTYEEKEYTGAEFITILPMK